MAIHLVTVVGSYVKVLPHMLAHYIDLGVNSFLICLHLSDVGDSIKEEVEEIVKRFGCKIEATVIGDWPKAHTQLISACMQKYPNDWFIIADQDELQVYPRTLQEIVAESDERGYDYVTGCFVDRLAIDGSFIQVKGRESIWNQFPLGGFITFPLIQGNPKKVVAAKGSIELSQGHHRALNGRMFPSEQVFVQVHHFKWVKDLVKRLQKRADLYESIGVSWGPESRRFVQYYNRNRGRIDINDPRFLIEKCDRYYSSWDIVRAIVKNIN